jgi:hypothetical protein
VGPRIAFAIAAFVSMTAGCCAPEGTYLGNRLCDLSDAGYIEVTLASAGVLANGGPFLLGYVSHFEMQPGSGTLGVRLGLGGFGHGFRFVGDEARAEGLIVPLSYAPVEARSTWYGLTWPPWGSFGFRAGWLVGVGLGIDLVELADFLVGLSTIDLVGDDAPSRTPAEGAAGGISRTAPQAANRV